MAAKIKEYIPKETLFQVTRFVSKGSHDKRKTKRITVNLIRIKLSNTRLTLKRGEVLTKWQLGMFNDKEKTTYLIKQENGKND